MSTPPARRASAALPFERVLELHGPALLRFCAAQAGPQRDEDVFQETVLAALRAAESLRDPAAARAWLFAIATRKAVDSHRARARAPQPVADPEVPQACEHDDVARAVAEDDALRAQLRELPDKQRQAVTLRYLGDLSHREVARAMQTSEEAARRNVLEGLRRLRARLEPAQARGAEEA